jgi:hypothetical protein
MESPKERYSTAERPVALCEKVAAEGLLVLDGGEVRPMTQHDVAILQIIAKQYDLLCEQLYDQTQDPAALWAVDCSKLNLELQVAQLATASQNAWVLARDIATATKSTERVEALIAKHQAALFSELKGT